MSCFLNAAGVSAAKGRGEIAEGDKWDLSGIYKGWGEWEADLKGVGGKVELLKGVKGTLGRSGEEVLKAYRLLDEIGMGVERLYGFAHMSGDTDTRDQAVAARLQEVEALYAKFGTEGAFFTPELLRIPWTTMEKWLVEVPGLAVYRFPISEAYRKQKHVLEESGEKLLSYGARFGESPRSIYRELSTSDIVFPTVKFSDGAEAKLTPGVYQAVLATNRKQADRGLAAMEYLKTYAAMKNTYAAVYNGILQRDWAMAQSRNYGTTLEAALDRGGIPTEVVETLVKVVREGTEPLQRYLRLRKRLLGLKDYHLYDNMISIYESERKYGFEEVKADVTGSVKVLGQEYQELMRRLVGERRTDVYESEGKRSGAYSTGVYGAGAFMLMNFNETLDAAFTYAHECGHSVHTMLSYATQPYATADYTIFVAEVASTLNERLFLDYLMERTTDAKERFVLLQHAVDNIVGTFYTQVLFAAFELEAHGKVERGEAITAEVLSGIYEGLLKEFYGDAIARDELYRVTWARIPHFYNSPYYVYQYATCFASSAKIYEGLKGGDAEGTRKRYLELLKSGGNANPMEQLKKAGVDLKDAETVRAVVRQMDELVGLLEREAGKIEEAR